MNRACSFAHAVMLVASHMQKESSGERAWKKFEWGNFSPAFPIWAYGGPMSAVRTLQFGFAPDFFLWFFNSGSYTPRIIFEEGFDRRRGPTKFIWALSEQGQGFLGGTKNHDFHRKPMFSLLLERVRCRRRGNRCDNSSAGRRSQLCESSPAGTLVDGSPRAWSFAVRAKLASIWIRAQIYGWSLSTRICSRFLPINFPGVGVVQS